MTATNRTTAARVGRVGGLAAALGIGAVIGLSTCGAAAAAPAESTGAATRADAAANTSAPARRTPATNQDHAVARDTPRPVAASRIAATSLRTVSAPTAVAAPEPAVIPSAEAVQAAPAVAPSRTSRRNAVAVTPGVRAAAITFPWCDPRGRLITIYKGTHFAIPNSFGYFIKQTVGTGTFTTNTVYDLKDVDQYDWNKFTGIAFTPLEPDRNSAMVGWRYNLTTQEFEIAPFYNVDKKRILPNENPSSPGYEVISVPAGETFQFNVDYTGITVSYGGRTVFKPYPPGLVANVWTAARVSGWFGGNEVAPRTVSYYLHLN